MPAHYCHSQVFIDQSKVGQVQEKGKKGKHTTYLPNITENLRLPSARICFVGSIRPTEDNLTSVGYREGRRKISYLLSIGSGRQKISHILSIDIPIFFINDTFYIIQFFHTPIGHDRGSSSHRNELTPRDSTGHFNHPGDDNNM
jgi:hypothetical protein